MPCSGCLALDGVNYYKKNLTVFLIKLKKIKLLVTPRKTMIPFSPYLALDRQTILL